MNGGDSHSFLILSGTTKVILSPGFSSLLVSKEDTRDSNGFESLIPPFPSTISLVRLTAMAACDFSSVNSRLVFSQIILDTM